MYRNLDWIGALKIRYDMSVPNAAHLDPQAGGCCTVFPFFVGEILEIPTTMTQDYSLFHILGQYSIELWKQQISIIAGKNGLACFVVHPDYIATPKARRVYSDLLCHLSEMKAAMQTWIALPGEVDEWWRQRRRMKLIRSASHSWRIEGQGSERARWAWAVLDGQGVRYEHPAVDK